MRGTAILFAVALLGAGARVACAEPVRIETGVRHPKRSPAEADSGGPYRALIRALAAQSFQDTVGAGEYAVAVRAYESNDFDDAARLFKEFSQHFPRSLLVNDALETMFLIRENREFDDQPLRIYVAAMKLRQEGRIDSAVALVHAGLVRYPGAHIRHEWNYMLAETARDRGDHDAAIAYALAVADTAAHSHLAPYALQLAGDETLAIGKNPDRALRLYQELLERYPDSPLAPPVRARLLELRKKLQL